MPEPTEFTPAAEQPEPKLERGECLRNSLNMAMDDPGLGYAEGVAKNHLGLWYCHAWNVNEAGEAVDYTWKITGSRYLGRVIGTEQKLAAVVETEVYHFDMANLPYVPDGEMGIDCLSRQQAAQFQMLREMTE